MNYDHIMANLARNGRYTGICGLVTTAQVGPDTRFQIFDKPSTQPTQDALQDAPKGGK